MITRKRSSLNFNFQQKVAVAAESCCKWVGHQGSCDPVVGGTLVAVGKIAVRKDFRTEKVDIERMVVQKYCPVDFAQNCLLEVVGWMVVIRIGFHLLVFQKDSVPGWWSVHFDWHLVDPALL